MDGSITTTVRAMTPADAARVAALAGELGYPSSPAQIEARLREMEGNPDSRVLVASDPDGEIWGWVHVFGYHPIVVDSDSHAEVGGLVVDARARGRGIGTLLMSAAEDWARARGYRHLALRSNTIRTEAHRFYLDRGYVIVKSQFRFQKVLV